MSDTIDGFRIDKVTDDSWRITIFCSTQAWEWYACERTPLHAATFAVRQLGRSAWPIAAGNQFWKRVAG